MLDNCIRLGCPRENSSVAQGISISMNLEVVIEDRRDVFVLFRLLNNRSAVHVVTGSVAKMVNRPVISR